MTNIYYTDDDTGKRITELEAETIQDHNINYEVNGQIRKIEFYHNRQLEYIEYFIDSEETVTDVLQTLGTNTVLIVTSETFPHYVVRTSVNYRAGEFIGTEKELLVEGRRVCSLWKSKGGMIECEKYLYDKGSAKGRLDYSYEFNYHDDGSLKRISDLCGNEPNETPERLQYLLKYNPYYKNADFLPQDAWYNV